MEYRLLGRTGIKVTPLCLGAMMFGGRTEFEDGVAIIERAMSDGINFIDTANVYSRGVSEQVVGEAVKRRGNRDKLVIATKVHGVMDDDDPNGQGNTRRHIIQQCEESLKRLQTDWIDLYQIHRPQSDVPIDETLRAMDHLIRAGKVRYIGTSTYAAWQLMESIHVSDKLNLNRFVCEQPPYNLLDRRIERELLPFCETYGFGVIPWSPLAGGLLAGRYHRGQPLPEDGRFASASPVMQRRLTDRTYDIIEGLEPIAEGKEVSLSQLALAWTMQAKGVTAPIIGPRTMEQYEDNMEAMRIHLSEEDLRAIDQVSPPGDNVSPYYEADFGPSQFR